MSLKEEIESKVNDYMGSRYEITGATVVPDKTSISFGAKGKKLWARVMYVDMRNSRELLREHPELIVARTHKSFLYAAAKCIRDQGGSLRSFNGDSILAFFPGKEGDVAVRAVRSAMKVAGAIEGIINLILRNKIGKALDFGIGVAQGEILVVKSGIPGEEINQDLIWIGWPTYYAFENGDRAKSPKHIWITDDVHDSLKKEEKLIISSSDGKNMWFWRDEQFANSTRRVHKTSYRILL